MKHMKLLIAALILLPTFIAVLLFIVAGFSWNNPTMLAASTNPTIAVLCVIAGVVATLPLIAAVVVGVIYLLNMKKNKKSEGESSIK